MKDNQLRIIAGKWRGRKIQFKSSEGLRPTGDRVRETLFNWLQQDIANAHVLDLFAGSGVLGFEALSRGAASVTFVDNHAAVIASLQENARVLQVQNLQIMQSDFAALQIDKKFDLVFVDPPFKKGLLEKALAHLLQQQLLANGALLYLEHERELTFNVSSAFTCLKQKVSGEVAYSLWQYQKVMS